MVFTDKITLYRSIRYLPDLFSSSFVLANKLDQEKKLIQDLKKLRFTAIITGFETGILKADQLSHILNLACKNPIETVSARFDKYETNKLAIQKGILTTKQIKVDLNDIKNNLKKFESIPLPIVIKPTQSAGSFGVYYCDTAQDIARACSEIVSTEGCCLYIM